MRFILSIPLIAVVMVIYAAFAMDTTFSSGSAFMDAMLPSETELFLTFGDIFVMLGLVALFFVRLPVAAPLWLLAFAVLSCWILGVLGLVAGLWSEKFDQLAAFQNFLIMPLTMLSGVFYSIHSLPPFWQQVSHFNPVFYMIDGFRYGFFGVSDAAPQQSLLVVSVCFAALTALTLALLKRGYKLRA